MALPIISLTTDFGDSPYVGQIKGVLACLVPNGRIVDLTHAVPPQDVVFAALALADTVPHFPDGSIHIAVVDPGVGTERPLVAAKIGSWFVLGPDNGLLSELAQCWPLVELVTLNRPEYWRNPVSATFHGRDILAPIAARIALGQPLSQLGEPKNRLHESIIAPPLILPNKIVGTTLTQDSFGNLVTNIQKKHLFELHGQTPRIRMPGYGFEPKWVRTYGDAAAGDCVALIGSSGRLEISVVNGNAGKLFVPAATSIEITW
jgi:S-adenosylmethionine hydrolase